MDNFKRDKYYVDKIIADLKFLIAHTQNLTLADIQKDEVLLDCIMFRLVQISVNSGSYLIILKTPTSRFPGLRLKVYATD